ncbi:hypothetical protein CEE37_07020 [candidate division LCP-89 bacterium B3_LCP]|uniref:DUF4386 domain-containing protein n=1 Tax=candidate division LCP-89 bacterium B3_LCP TaxID=2012998 RepID=A0A532V0N8_UNCL8|nr:MAG: hypothetical protein CEE37_07020 [candidate division LCP-89 bacterium B3_LCP]
MNVKELHSMEAIDMSENRFQLAGYLAIANAFLFPLSFVIAIVQGILTGVRFGYQGPIYGPSDLVMLVFTAFGIYILLRFKLYLHEHYNYSGIDSLIHASIWWGVLLQIGSLILRGMILLGWPDSELFGRIGMVVFMSISMLTIGVIDIMIAVKLMKIKDTLSDMMKVFLYITLVAGICEVSILLVPISLILIPVTNVVLAMIFLREKHEVEFV